jgi:hypothetical protein
MLPADYGRWNLDDAIMSVQVSFGVGINCATCCASPGPVCPTAKQIVGSKLWIGYAQSFGFPGFKDNFSGWWGGGTGTWAGGGNFAVGDLALREVPSQTSYDGTITYPAYYYVYQCVAAVSGSTTDPATDTAHFQPWNYDVTSGASAGGPSGWPAALNIGTRQVWTYSTDTSYFELTVTTAFANCPSVPGTGWYDSVHDTTWPWNDIGQPAFNLACEHVDSANSPFVYEWTFPNRYDGTIAALTGPTPPPDTDQALLLFPAVPLTPLMQNGPDALNQLFANNFDLPRLVGLTASATSISFEFGIWINDTIGPGYIPVGGAPATVTQTLTLGGAAYTLAEVAADAVTLRDATSFSSLAWGTSWTNTWNPSGGLVTTQNLVHTVETDVTGSLAVGTTITWGAAVNGLYTFGVSSAYASKCQVIPCAGNYCKRDYTLSSVTCYNHTADGTTAYEYDTPSTPGYQTGLYNACIC